MTLEQLISELGNQRCIGGLHIIWPPMPAFCRTNKGNTYLVTIHEIRGSDYVLKDKAGLVKVRLLNGGKDIFVSPDSLRLYSKVNRRKSAGLDTVDILLI